MTFFKKNKIFLAALDNCDFKNHDGFRKLVPELEVPRLPKVNVIDKRKTGGFNLILFLLCMLSVQTLNAQRSDSNTGRPANTGGDGSGQQNIQFSDQEEIDTSKVFYFFADNPSKEYLFTDTLLDNYLHQYSPARKRELEYGSLGFMGSPLNQLVYQPAIHRGFEVGLHQYDLYKIRSKDLRFYNIKKPYSDFYFSQGAAQDDIQLKTKFAQDFAGGIKLSFDYNRISQFGGNTDIPYLYENQKARHTNLALGLAFQKETYNSYFVFSSNTHQQNDNGGIQSNTAFSQQTAGLESTLNIPVWLSSASSRHDEKEVRYTQYFVLGKKKKKKATPPPSVDTLLQIPMDSLNLTPNDSLNVFPTDSLKQTPPDTLSKNISPKENKGKSVVDSKSTRPPSPNQRGGGNRRPPIPFSPPPTPPVDDTGRKFTLAHSIAYQTAKYKFAAIPPDTASAYWNDLLLDIRGLRHYLEKKQLENSFDLSTFKKRKSKDSDKSLQNDLLQVGIVHTISWINEEAADSTINNLFLNGKWNFNPSEKLKVETYAHFGLWDNAGDYRVNGNFFFDLKKLGQLQLSATNQLYKPNLLQQRLYISERAAWRNDFGRTVETNLAVTYAYPKFKFKASGQYHLLNNFIYYDTLAKPQQFAGAMSILQLTLSQDFKMGGFHLDNVVTFQTSTEDILRLPSIYSKHSLYYNGRWFKRALNVRLGIDARMNNAYLANTYNPLVGQFHLQDTNEVTFYPVLDAVASIKVKRFRFFIKWENFTRWGKPINEKYYQVANYPVLDKSIRFGLAWRFSD